MLSARSRNAQKFGGYRYELNYILIKYRLAFFFHNQR